MAPGSPRSSAPEAAAPRAVPLLGGARLPLAFILYGLGCYVIACGWLAARPSLLLEPHLHPRVVALVHLLLPGFLLSVTLGAFYQLVPVVLGTPLPASLRALWLHFAMHVTGSATLVGGFIAGRFEWVGAGGLVVSSGILFFTTTIWHAFRASNRRDAVAWSFPLSATWLSATVLMGVLLAAHRRWPFLPLSSLALLRAHAHLGLAGFFLTLLQGATFQLVPMFTMGTARRMNLVWAGLLCTQAGLLMLAPALAGNLRALVIGGALVIAAGIGLSGVALKATLNSRRRKKIEPGIRAFLFGASLLLAAAGTGVALVFLSFDHETTPRLISAYGALAIVGALSLMVLGMLCKIVPFLVWMRTYGPLVGKRPVPVATELSSKRLELLWACAHLAAVPLIACACARGSLACALAGACLLAVAAAVFVANLGRVLAHLIHPKPPPPAGPLATSLA